MILIVYKLFGNVYDYQEPTGLHQWKQNKNPFFFVTGDRITRLVQEKTSPRLNVILMLTFKRISYHIFMNNMQHVGSLTVVQFLG